MKKQNKKKVWVGYANEHWVYTCGLGSDGGFILCNLSKNMTPGMTKKVRVTVEEIR